MFCWLRLSSRDARPGSTNENSRVSVIKRSRKKKKTNAPFGYFKSSSAVVKDIFHIYGVDSRNKGYAKIHMEKNTVIMKWSCGTTYFKPSHKKNMEEPGSDSLHWWPGGSGNGLVLGRSEVRVQQPPVWTWLQRQRSRCVTMTISHLHCHLRLMLVRGRHWLYWGIKSKDDQKLHDVRLCKNNPLV